MKTDGYENEKGPAEGRERGPFPSYLESVICAYRLIHYEIINKSRCNGLGIKN
jgi:hypothetical protein